MIPTKVQTISLDKCWSVKKTGNKKAELLIYGVIDDMVFWGDEVTPKEIDAALKAAGEVDELTIRINSPGGSTTSGMAIFSMLNRHTASKTIYIEGVAASMATVLACLPGARVIITKGSMYMIHNPVASLRNATAPQFINRANLLIKITGEMVDIYSAKSSKDAEEIQPMLDAETWMTAEEAVSNGFADEIESNLEISACIRGDIAIVNGVEMPWAIFSNAPKLPEDANNQEEEQAKEALRAKISARQRELELKFRR